MLLDNGAYMLKGAIAATHDLQPFLEFNAAIRGKSARAAGTQSIGNQAINDLRDGRFDSRCQTVVHPQVRGLLQDSDLQSQIWSQLF